jgi:putative transposase
VAHLSVQAHYSWVVERTIAWIGRYRRLSQEYEDLSESSETMIY